MNKIFTKHFLTATLIAFAGSAAAQTFNYANQNKLEFLINSEAPSASPTFSGSTPTPYFTERITGFYGALNNGRPIAVTGVASTSNTFRRPLGLAFDGSSYYVGEAQGNRIKKVDFALDQVNELFASNTAVDGGTALDGLAIHPKSGKFYVANGSKSNVLEIDRSQTPVTFNVVATGITNPKAIAITPDGLTMYVADYGGHRILKANFTKTTVEGVDIYSLGAFSVFAGSGTKSRVDGAGLSASFRSPAGIALDKDGNILVAEHEPTSGAIRKVTPTGDVSTLVLNSNSKVEFKTVTEETAVIKIDYPFGITISNSGVVYVGDYVVNGLKGKIYKITDVLEHVVGKDETSPTEHNTAGTQHTGYGTELTLRGPRQLVIGRNNKLAFTQRDYHALSETTINHFSISPALPAGLKFDESTGKIYGTPTSLFAAQDFTVSYSENADGTVTSTQTVKLAVVSVLPVTLASFEAKKQTNGNVSLTWATSSETDNNKFVLSRSNNGTTYNTLVERTSLGAQGGNYSFTDVKPASGANYYKLQQVDNDGTSTDLGIKVVQGGLVTAAWSVYPNPSKGNKVTVNYSGNRTTETAKVYDVAGRLVHSQVVTLNGDTTLSFNPSLAKGIYTISLGTLGVQKLIVE
jgi:hypothetical protein